MKKATSATEPENHIAVFQETTIRRVWHNEEWWFALSDVIVVLTDSADSRQYIKKMRSRDAALDANWGTTCTCPRQPRPICRQTFRQPSPQSPKRVNDSQLHRLHR